MPKLIENLRERLIDETRRTLLEEGPSAVNIRAIAQACGAATGTVYNYFPSKEELIAHAILGDWLEHVGRARSSIADCADVTSGLAAIQGCLVDFVDSYRPTFAASSYALAGPVYAERHTMLCNQLAGLIDELAKRFGLAPSAIAEEVMAESLLASVTHGWPTDELMHVLEKLIS
ncbi:MAG: TetR/AcrR family transcriptional regulator [Coriobacteriaceae bacterium]|nr:TetR/AcrR family transcriptional regulator [Coriobacteriaceae bacterium]